jgi:Bacterial Ig domain
MKKSVKHSGFALASASLLILSACGGGGGTTPVAQAVVTPVATDFTLSGTAATGAALAGATIVVTDKDGKEVCNQIAAADGSYSCTIPLTAKGPFVIVATLDEQSLVSTVAEAVTSTANVTPLTNLIAARLSPSGDPKKLVDELKANNTLYDKAALKAKVDDLLAALKPLLDALGDGTNPITGVFKADGSGHDRLLDAVQVSVRPDGTGSNIELTVKTSSASTAAPISVSFRSNAQTAPVMAPVAAASLPVTGVPILVSSFLSKLQSCYALPAVDRVTEVVNNGSASPSTVKAPACKAVFEGDDPKNYLSNGQRIGSSRAANNFSGLFRDGATGLKLDRGNLEFLRSNGDMVITYRWTDVAGNTDNDQVVVRKVGDELRLIGNQYAYNANVRAWVQNRDFINTPSFSYLATGYNIAIKNQTDVNGNPIFSRVEVTSPNGGTLKFAPSAGRSNLVLQDGTSTFNTSVIRLAAKYIDPATAGNPVDKEGINLFFKATQFTDAELAAIPDQGVWTLKFVHADTNMGDVTQAYKTTSRAPTLAEASYMTFANVTPAWRSESIASTSTNGVFLFGAPSVTSPNRVDISANNNLDAWTVPSGALAPTSVTAYGRAPRIVSTTPGLSFDDGITVATNSRKTVITCSPQSVADLHCATVSNTATPPVSFTQYAQNTSVNSIELWARSPRQVEVSKMIAIYKIQ